MSRCLFLLLLVCGIQQSWAETVYIKDQIFVPLRAGTTDQHKILHKGIRSGTPLELISEDSASGFSFVRMKNGMEGWIRTQYISTNPIASDLLQVATHQLATLKKENSEFRQTIETLNANATSLMADNNTLSQQAQRVQEELDRITRLATNVISINKENLHLQDRNTMLLDELDALSQINTRLMRSQNKEWFLVGAMTLLVGMFPGFWFARKIYNRRTSGWA
jgi:SH3 domain protein